MPSISFRPLQSTDFAMLQDWLCRPHVAEWWTPVPTLAEVEADFTPMLAPDSPDRGYIALYDGQPLGFIQSYVVMGSGDGWWEDERDPGARGIDQFLAQADQLNRGLGSAMVRAFTAQLFADPAVTRIQTDPSPRNARAIRSYAKAGFHALGEVTTPDGPALLMVRERDV
ncbi:GNAT family N-acetyltransferase [Variovorax boronicumulans]|uniref:GNAT family N-acetyltransferase n=1 Tax=Variovorax boronicumulans TaxID=436515 RepID=UPI000784BFEC|nr:GNAT family N-acetyltransferase [Variovorax boronicumulans]